MLIQQGSPPAGFAVVCDTQVLTVGVPSYTAPASVKVSVNGGALGAAASTITASTQPGASGPYVARVALAAGDYVTVGSVLFVLEDAGGNVVGSVLADVVLNPDVNVKKMAGTTVNGLGTSGSPWGP